jgi:hypothetical protein
LVFAPSSLILTNCFLPLSGALEVPMNILKKIPQWSSFKSLGSNKIIKSSYWWLFLVPMLAKLLESAGDKLELTLFNSKFIITLNLPFSWSLFYFSAVCFSIASIIYLIKCPYSIDKYNNFEEWKISGKDSTSLITSFLYHYRNDKIMTPFAISEEDKNHFLKHHLQFTGDCEKVNKTSGTPLVLLREGIPEGNLKETYYYVYGKSNFNKSLSRLSLMVFYGLGFLFFSIVLIQNFIFVCKHL